MEQGLVKLLRSELRLPEASVLNLLDKWQKTFHLRRGDTLIRKGQVERYLYYIASGTMGIFYELEEEQTCVGFGYAHSLICSIPSFLRNKPSEYSLEALSSLTLQGISRTDFYQLLHTDPALERVWHNLIEEALLGRIEREIDLLTPSPRDRLQRLLNRSPHIFQLVPLKYIASYLRMTPETLSRSMKS